MFSKDQGDVYFMKGAFEEVIRSCTTYNNGGIALPLTPQQEALCLQEERRMGSLGLRGQCRPSPGSKLPRACGQHRVPDDKQAAWGWADGASAPPQH